MMEDESDVDSVVSWTAVTPTSPASVVQWTPPVNNIQELTSDRSVVPWSASSSPVITTSPPSEAAIATKTPSRKQRVSLPRQRQTPLATAMRKKISFSLSVDFSTAEKGDSSLKSTSYDYCALIMSVNGCNERCASTIHHLTESDIWLTYQRFSHLSSYQQRQWVLDCLHNNTSKSDSETFFFVCGKNVCLPVWLSVLDLSKSRFYDVRRSFLEGSFFVERLTSPTVHQPKSCEAIAWMQNYFSQVGDCMPDRMAVHLPSFLTNALVYSRMKDELEASGRQVISQSHFYNLWSSEFPHVSIPKESRFTKCDTCTLVKSELQKTTDSERRKYYSDILEKHNALQRQERARYYLNREKARQEPQKYLSIIIDGMDQNKTDLPHFTRKNKSACNMWILRTHVTGAIVHGKRSFAFIDLLLQLKQLPPVLYLQLDNCYRENKNQFLFGFLALLVHHKLFKEIELGFLMVGHTHEDIDQFFSKFSQYLRHNQAHTLPDLMAAVKNCYSDVPEANHVDCIFDVKSWLAKHILPLHNHSHPHVFRFSTGESGEVVMHYKEWSESSWEPHGNGIKLFKSTPSGFPTLVQPSLDRLDFSKLCAHAKMYRQKSGISEEDQAWWIDYLSGLETFVRSYDLESSEVPVWPLQEFIEARVHTAITQNPSIAPPEHIVSLQRKEIGAHPKVYSGTRPRYSQMQQPSALTTQNVDMSSGDGQQPLTNEVCAQDADSRRIMTLGAEQQTPTTNGVPRKGELVALCCKKYNERPQIAKVLSSSAHKVKVRWYDGSWSKKWVVYTYLQGRPQRKVPWDEEVDINDIVSTNIKLTASGVLTAQCKRELEQCYKDL